MADRAIDPGLAGLTRRAAAGGVLALAAGASPLTVLADPLDVAGDQFLQGRKDRSLRLTTPVLVNGSGPYDFVVDTGANRSVISAELAAALQLPAGPPTHIHGILSLQDAQTVNARSFTAGPIPLPLSGVPTLKREDLGCDGFLGLDAFRGRQVVFDFKRGRVAIRRAGSEDSDVAPPHAGLTSDVIVRARQRYGQLMITDAQAEGQWISCFVDSGAQRSVGNLAMRAAVKARTGDRGFAPISVILHGATGQVAHGEVAQVQHLNIGLLRFTGFNLTFADLHTFSLWGMQDQPALMVGMDLLSLFEHVVVDFRQSFVRFRMARAIDLAPSA